MLHSAALTVINALKIKTNLEFQKRSDDFINEFCFMSQLLKKYSTYLLLEQGLSDNTREAYTHDVKKLLDYLALGQIDPLEVTLDDLHRFAFALYDVGIAPSSVGRILSGVRSFYRFLLLDGVIGTAGVAQTSASVAHGADFGGGGPAGGGC